MARRSNTIKVKKKTFSAAQQMVSTITLFCFTAAVEHYSFLFRWTRIRYQIKIMKNPFFPLRKLEIVQEHFNAFVTTPAKQTNRFGIRPETRSVKCRSRNKFLQFPFLIPFNWMCFELNWLLNWLHFLICVLHGQSNPLR